MRLRVRNLELQDYQAVWEGMRQFTDSRDEHTMDELWLTEHPPVYTLGRNGDPGHILKQIPLPPGDYRGKGSIPVIQTDRGGQVTYHGPGQLVAYTLFDLRRHRLGPRGLVNGLENAIVSMLGRYGIVGEARSDAPGVYVTGRKIASLGLRIRRGCSYHGLSLNVNPDLTPFQAINPCGYRGLEVTRMSDLGAPITTAEAAVSLIAAIMQKFGYDHIEN
jgi:lipoyl(octanoyl) transferase